MGVVGGDGRRHIRATRVCQPIMNHSRTRTVRTLALLSLAARAPLKSILVTHHSYSSLITHQIRHSSPTNVRCERRDGMKHCNDCIIQCMQTHRARSTHAALCRRSDSQHEDSEAGCDAESRAPVLHFGEAAVILLDDWHSALSVGPVSECVATGELRGTQKHSVSRLRHSATRTRTTAHIDSQRHTQRQSHRETENRGTLAKPSRAARAAGNMQCEIWNSECALSSTLNMI